MQDLWERLEAHATKHGRSLRLRPGASEEAIVAAEQVIGMRFPEDFRASLLLHDGQEPGEGDDRPFEFLPGCSPLATVSAIAAQWKDEQGWAMAANGDHTPEILNTVKHPRRIPIAGTPWWDGDTTYLDLTPAAAGTIGQVITFTSECDMSVLGPSFRGALETYIKALDDRSWNYAASLKKVIGPEGYEDGNLSWCYGEWLAAHGAHHDANSGTHEPFDGALPAAAPEPPAPAPKKAATKKAAPAKKKAKPAVVKKAPAVKKKPAAKKKPAVKKKAAAKKKPAAKQQPAAKKKAKPVATKKKRR